MMELEAENKMLKSKLNISSQKRRLSVNSGGGGSRSASAIG